MAPPVLLGLRLRCAYHRCRAGAFSGRQGVSSILQRRMPVGAHRSRASAARLRRCSVEIIPRSEAVTLIRRYERLGSVGSCSTFVGLRDPAGSLLACVGFGNGPHSGGRGVDAVLERGFTRRRAPRNSGSYLIGAALRFCRRTYGWGSVRSYTDPGAQRARHRSQSGWLHALPAVQCMAARTATPWRLVVGCSVDRQIYRGTGAMPPRAALALRSSRSRQGWLGCGGLLPCASRPEREPMAAKIEALSRATFGELAPILADFGHHVVPIDPEQSTRRHRRLADATSARLLPAAPWRLGHWYSDRDLARD